MLKYIARKLGKDRLFDFGNFTRCPHGKNVPQQVGSSDCGIFMLMFADCVSLGLTVDQFNFSQDDVDGIRERILGELLYKELTDERFFERF